MCSGSYLEKPRNVALFHGFIYHLFLHNACMLPEASYHHQPIMYIQCMVPLINVQHDCETVACTHLMINILAIACMDHSMLGILHPSPAPACWLAMLTFPKA